MPLSYQQMLTCNRLQYSGRILITKGVLYTINDSLLICKSRTISDLLAEPESSFFISLISQAPSNSWQGFLHHRKLTLKLSYEFRFVVSNKGLEPYINHQNNMVIFNSHYKSAYFLLNNRKCEWSLVV